MHSHTLRRIAASAWFNASTWSRARLQNSSTDRSAYWMCRPVAKSGQSICRVTSAAAIEATSASNTSREVVKMIGLHDSLLEEIPPLITNLDSDINDS